MNVSVVIPVHNAEAYIAEALYSALRQPETSEVITVDDGSTDRSAEICENIARNDLRVTVMRHADAGNHGVSASRNLGAAHASSEYVAFLDADDSYLPDRFIVAAREFQRYPSTEGVCEAIQAHFESSEAEENWRRCFGSTLTTISADVAPDQIFELQRPIGKCGHCHLDGLTVRREALRRAGPFDAELTMGEDLAFMVRLAACAALRLGRVDGPVAMRRIHSSNTITRPRSLSRQWQDRRAMWLAIYRWSRHSCTGNARHGLVVKRMLEEALTMPPEPRTPATRVSRFVSRLAGMVMNCPIAVCDTQFLRQSARYISKCR